MMNYSWPGNVRELRNAIHFVLVTSKGRVIYPENLPIELRKDAFGIAKPGPSEKLEADVAIATLKESGAAKPGPARKLDQYLVIAALKEAGGNKSRAAKLLGVGRATLYRFLKDMHGVS
jgi:DNA-binding NtrC family response regulator